MESCSHGTPPAQLLTASPQFLDFKSQQPSLQLQLLFWQELNTSLDDTHSQSGIATDTSEHRCKVNLVILHPLLCMLILSVPFVPLNQDPTTHLTASKALTHLFLTTPAKQQNNTISQHTTRTLTNAQDGIMQLELCTLFRIWGLHQGAEVSCWWAMMMTKRTSVKEEAFRGVGGFKWSQRMFSECPMRQPTAK